MSRAVSVRSMSGSLQTGNIKVPYSYFLRNKDDMSSIFLRSNRSKLYRSYIEEISKLYRRNELSDRKLADSWEDGVMGDVKREWRG